MNLLARNEEINKWLQENPIVLAGIFGTLGVVLIISGVSSFYSGKARDKYGNEMTEGMAFLIAGARFVGGVFAVGFAIYSLLPKE